MAIPNSTGTTAANPVNRLAPTGAGLPSFTLPQNHTLATDPFNQQAQMLAMGMPVAAFDQTGGNNGYYSQAMMNASPLMRNYSGNGLYSSNFLTNGLGMGMPGWQSTGNNSFTPTQANPFAAINYNAGQTVQPNLNQGSGVPPWLQGQTQGAQTPPMLAQGVQNPVQTPQFPAPGQNPFVPPPRPLGADAMTGRGGTSVSLAEQQSGAFAPSAPVDMSGYSIARQNLLNFAGLKGNPNQLRDPTSARAQEFMARQLLPREWTGRGGLPRQKLSGYQ